MSDGRSIGDVFMWGHCKDFGFYSELGSHWDHSGCCVDSKQTSGAMAETGRSVRRLYHSVDRMRVVWASVLAVEVGRYDWRSFKGTVDRIY